MISSRDEKDRGKGRSNHQGAKAGIENPKIRPRGGAGAQTK